MKLVEGGPSNRQLGLALTVIAIVIAAGSIYALYFLNPPPLINPPPIRVIDGTNQVEVTFDQLTGMPSIQANSSYQNRFGNWRGHGTYVGVHLATIVETVTTLDFNDIIRVNASDGYFQYYAHFNLYPNSSIEILQGDLVIAYSLNGTIAPLWDAGPSTAFLPADGGYSIDDANQTTHPAWFSGSGGARWVRNLESIEIIRDVFIPGSFNLIDGENKEIIHLVDLALMAPIQGTSGYQNFPGNWPANGTYAGIHLSTIVELLGTIDSNDVIRVNATDGFTQSYAHYNLYPNSSIQALQGDLILAYAINGSAPPDWSAGPQIAFLAPDEGYSNSDAALTTHPSWFSGSAGARWVRNVASIEILRNAFPPP